MTVTLPPNINDGDFLVMCYANNQAASNPAVSGWTPAVSVLDTGQIDILTRIFWRRADSEPSSYTLDKGSTYGQESAVVVARYTGVLAEGSPIRTTGSNYVEGRGGPSPGPVLSGVEEDDLVIQAFGGATGTWNSQNFTMAVADTSWNDRGSVFGIGTASVAMLVLDKFGDGNGPTATHSGTGAADSAARVGAIAIIPEPESVKPFRGWGIPIV